ncbi:MAG: hypothetical protein M3Z05_02015 [Gemmatimonadota bacterium]|nr:hypothetical protein [Gemmatimonadota bacterium]
MATHGKGLGDEQGTKVGPPDQAGRVPGAPHNDGPSGRPERSTGAGQEATIADEESAKRDREHQSGYGGKGGTPDSSSDKR